MKTIRIILLIAFVVFLNSCKKEICIKCQEQVYCATSEDKLPPIWQDQFRGHCEKIK